MRNNKYPVGNSFEFKGDITILDDCYFISKAEVETKKDLMYPYLQIHFDTGNVIRTISPNGSFNMWIHKPEYFESL